MKLRRILLPILVLAIVLTGPVAAQISQPPVDDAGFLDEQPFTGPHRALETTAVAASPNVPLGQPGTAYSYAQTFGETITPYLADAQHLNHPNGLAVDGSNSLYVVEEAGHRLLKYNSSGANTLTIGQAGLAWTHDAYLSSPKGVSVDPSGNIWVTIDNAIKAFDATGNVILMLPADNPWSSGTDNTHFDQPRGLAFDNAGRLFVADGNNHRIQIYTVSGSTLTYQSTIGQTGVAGSDNAHFNRPAEIAVDPSGRLYVADALNHRVQRCTYTTTWACSTFHGTGTAGGGTNQLNLAYGLGIDSAGSTIYIADNANGRVKKCTTNGACSTFITGLNWPTNVAVDTSGSVFVSNFYNYTVRKYSSGGSFLGIVAGRSGVPYLTDGVHYYRPWGVAVAPDGSSYIAESGGYRLIKLDRNGVPQWTIGEPGIHGNDNAHFGSFWAGPEGNLAIDAAGRVYVPDTGNHRIQVFNADGAFHRSFGQYGTGNTQFDCPAGVTISPVNGDIFVVDKCNQRIQVYTSNWVYRMTLGTLDVTGTDNQHFNWPQSVAVDANGIAFVADTNNYRVQKCTLSAPNYACTTFAGETGVFGSDYGHLNPIGVAVDKDGRVIVADNWNDRVQVFDANGAYLTTLGGWWGIRRGQMMDPHGVAVDQYGTLYVAEYGTHRVQKYTLGVPGWTQVNLNGFGDHNNWGAWSLGTFGGKLYTSTGNYSGAEVYRLSPAGAWERVASGGFGDASNIGIDRLVEFNGQLYASTWVGDNSGGQIWRSPTGNMNTWSQVAQGGLGSTNNSEFMTLTPFDGYLYAGTLVANTGIHGAEVWRSSTGDSGSWIRVASNGFDNDPNNGAILSMRVFAGALYAATANSVGGGEIWRTGEGMQWTQVNAGGFGSAGNTQTISLETFAGKLYAGTRNASSGGEIWRTTDGTSWERVLQGGFGNVDNRQIAALVAFRGEIFALAGNFVTGAEVWRSATGDSGSWRKVIDGGFGSGSTTLAAWDNHAAVFDGSLYIGTYTLGNGGGRLWHYLHNRVYLPALVAQ